MSDEPGEDEESPDDAGAPAPPEEAARDTSDDADDGSGSTSRSRGPTSGRNSGRSSGRGSGRGSGRSSGTGGDSSGTSSSSGGDDAGATDANDSGASGGGSGSAETAGDGGLLGGHGNTPPDDEELPLTEHIEEMLGRLAIVVVIASVVALAAFPFADDAIIQIWYDVHDGSLANCLDTPQNEGCVAPHLYSPAELVLMRLRFAGLAGLLVALPLAVYQTYRFMRPGLYPNERRYYLASVPFSLVLGLAGMLFSYFVILPLLFTYFITYSEGSAEIRFALADTMNLVLIMLGMMAIIFQIPLLIMLAIMMGITSRRWLEERRIYFWGLFLGIAFLFGPDPTGMAPILLTVTMIVLYEGSLLLLRWTGR